MVLRESRACEAVARPAMGRAGSLQGDESPKG